MRQRECVGDGDNNNTCLLFCLNLIGAPVHKGGVAGGGSGNACCDVEKPGDVHPDAQDAHVVVYTLDGGVFLTTGDAAKVFAESDCTHDVETEVAGPSRSIDSLLMLCQL